jgi:hypothetical protein
MPGAPGNASTAGNSPRRGPPGQPTRSPGQEQANHIAGVVAGVGEECKRTGPHPRRNLHHHKARVEPHAEHHRPVELARGHAVGPVMVMMVIVMLLLMMMMMLI